MIDLNLIFNLEQIMRKAEINLSAHSAKKQWLS